MQVGIWNRSIERHVTFCGNLTDVIDIKKAGDMLKETTKAKAKNKSLNPLRSSRGKSVQATPINHFDSCEVGFVY